MLADIGPWELLLVLLIVLMLFGTKRLRGLGGDLGSALRDFRHAMKRDDGHDTSPHAADAPQAGAQELPNEKRTTAPDPEDDTVSHGHSAR